MLSGHQKQDTTSSKRFMLDNTTTLAKFIHLITLGLSAGLNISILIVYLQELNTVEYMLRWFSYWNVFSSLGVSLFGICATVYALILWKVPHMNRRWIAVVESVRDVLYVANFLSLLLVCVAFWIGWYTAPYHLTYPSLVSHSVNLVAQILILCTTVVQTSFWSLIVGLTFVSAYYVFHLWYYFHYDVWVYDTLDLMSAPVLSRLVIIVIPIAMILVYFLFRIVNRWKNNKIASYLYRRSNSLHLWALYHDPLLNGGGDKEIAEENGDGDGEYKWVIYGNTLKECCGIQFDIMLLYQTFCIIGYLLYLLTTDQSAVFLPSDVWLYTWFDTWYYLSVAFSLGHLLLDAAFPIWYRCIEDPNYSTLPTHWIWYLRLSRKYALIPLLVSLSVMVLFYAYETRLVYFVFGLFILQTLFFSVRLITSLKILTTTRQYTAANNK